MDPDSERLEVGALSETGYVREENQDRMSWSTVALGHLYIVADGMGGHKGGALAAQMVVEELQRQIGQAAAGAPLDAVIQTAFKTANDAVYKRSHSGDASVEGMGTTAVLLLVSGRMVKVAHVGDSRAYLYRNNTLSPLTRDHTVVQRMVQAGMLKPEEAADHPHASVLERAIGSAPTVEADIKDHKLQEGDALMLCSDGLCGYVTDPEIEAVLRAEGSVQETTANLVRLALDRGGHDNTTVQLIRYGARKPAPAPRQTRIAPAAAPPSAPAARARPRSGLGPTAKILAFVVAGAVTGAATAGSLVMHLDNRKAAGESETVRQLREELATTAAREKALGDKARALDEKLQQRVVAAPPPETAKKDGQSNEVKKAAAKKTVAEKPAVDKAARERAAAEKAAADKAAADKAAADRAAADKAAAEKAALEKIAAERAAAEKAAAEKAAADKAAAEKSAAEKTAREKAAAEKAATEKAAADKAAAEKATAKDAKGAESAPAEKR